MLGCLYPVIYADTVDDAVPESIRIRRSVMTNDIDREGFSSVNACFWRGINQIELSCSGIGTAEIYVVDSSDKIVGYDVIDSSINNSLFIDTPHASGVYTLIIWSEKYYGEGTFTIN